MTNDAPTVEKRSNGISVFIQLLPALMILLCMIFVFYLGLQFYGKPENQAPVKPAPVNRVSDASLLELQQMSATIKEEFDLILDMRRENQELRQQLQFNRREDAAMTNLNMAHPNTATEISH